jgi:hypothetical protein
MLYPLTGLRNGQPYPPVGGVMELIPGDLGADLIRNKYAEEVKGVFAGRDMEVETATVAPPENAIKRGPGRPRKA